MMICILQIPFVKEKHFCRVNNKLLILQMHQGKTFCTEYEKSKVLADQIALQAAAEGMPITIVYPGFMYGPGKLTAGNLVSRIVRQFLYS